MVILRDPQPNRAALVPVTETPAPTAEGWARKRMDISISVWPDSRSKEDLKSFGAQEKGRTRKPTTPLSEQPFAV
jgi:hypothetical protein